MGDGGIGLDQVMRATVAAAFETVPRGATMLADVDWTPLRAAGRLHPLWVHFPIAFALAAAAIESWRGVRREPGLPTDGAASATPALLIAAAITAIAATGSGWLNAAWEHGRDASDNLFWHRWIGTGSTVLLVALATIAMRSRRCPPFASLHAARRSGAFVAAICVAVAGHLGGELVHGEGYVLAAFRSRERDPVGGKPTSTPRGAAPVAALPVSRTPEETALAAAAMRVFDAHCVECHGAKKQKGGLRLAPIAAAFIGPRTDWVIVPGAPDASELIARVELPADDLDAMPPEGERLSDADVAALRAWIAAGARVPAEDAAPEDERDARVDAPADVVDVAAALAPIEARGGRALPVAQGASEYEVDVSRAAPPWGDADVERLSRIAPAIVELNLAGAAIGDAGVARLPTLPRVERVRLDGTRVGDGAVTALLAMPKLVSVNLVGTGLTDDGLARLAAHPTLVRVFVWRTQVTAAGAARAKQTRPALDIVGVGDAPQ